MSAGDGTGGRRTGEAGDKKKGAEKTGREKRKEKTGIGENGKERDWKEWEGSFIIISAYAYDARSHGANLWHTENVLTGAQR